jgi:23S rRNA pseudouridine1911/1915/1917 synthase
MENLFEVIHECDDLLVINKPAGLVCHPTKGDAYSSLISRARLYLGSPSEPQMINRLDRETSGIVLVAKNPTTALELRRIWESRSVVKTYFAIVHGHVAAETGQIEAPLGKDQASQVAIKDCVRADGASAETRFAVCSRFSRDQGKFSLLRVEPLTGRKHQIRIHLAHIGHSVVGDKLYGGDENLYLAFVKYQLDDPQRARLILPNHALHAQEVRFLWNGTTRVFTANPEGSFMEFANIGNGCLARHHNGISD